MSYRAFLHGGRERSVYRTVVVRGMGCFTGKMPVFFFLKAGINLVE